MKEREGLQREKGGTRDEKEGWTRDMEGRKQ